jgi:hypothetical protein
MAVIADSSSEASWEVALAAKRKSAPVHTASRKVKTARPYARARPIVPVMAILLKT